jgi:hypothetical protein
MIEAVATALTAGVLLQTLSNRRYLVPRDCQVLTGEESNRAPLTGQFLRHKTDNYLVLAKEAIFDFWTTSKNFTYDTLCDFGMPLPYIGCMVMPVSRYRRHY